jgi:adenosylcobinamide-phosphate synthase
MDFSLLWYILPAAFFLDLLFGDPPSWPHPVRWMGKAIEVFEPYFRKISRNLVLSGALFTAFLVAVSGLLCYLVLHAAQLISPWLRTGIEIVLIYFCISARSLEDAAMEIYNCLRRSQVDDARKKVALIVGRDVNGYEQEGISRAVVETVAENLVDGVISPLFFAALGEVFFPALGGVFFPAIGGASLAVAYKMVNTLDSMIGYKNEKYMQFGKVSARLDDILNFLPARLSVPIISLATQLLSGAGARSWRTAICEGANHSSPNAGYPEAAFAGALAVKLNGPNYYNGKLVNKPYIGVHFGKTSPVDIKKACHIMMLSSLIWLVVVWGASVGIQIFL